MFSDWKIRVRALLNRKAVERELDDELRFHYERQVDRYVDEGLDRSEASRRARLSFGSFDQIKEECRDARGIRVIDNLGRDVLYGFRMLWRRPLSSAAAIATLAVGIGLNAAVFSVVDWVLLRPLPYPSPQELVKVFSASTSPVTGPANLTHSEFEALSQVSAFRAAAAFSTATRVIAGQGFDPVHVVVARVAGDLFQTLGIYPEIGVGFDLTKTRASAPVLVVSQQLWRDRFSADPLIVGRIVTIDGQPHTLVGVMPLDRGYPKEADVWRLVTADEREDDDREQVMIARLANDIPVARANVQLQTVASANSNGARTAWAEDLQRTDVHNVRAALTGLLAAAALILFIACANVAALLGARSVDRSAELAVRGALGASRSRLLQQLLTETVLLAIVGGVAGLLLGRWALDLLVSLAPADLPRVDEVTLDTRVLVAGIGATMIVGLAVGLMPAHHVSRADFRSGLGVAGSARAGRRATGRRLLVVAQTAMAVVLAIGAGLLARSLQHLLSIDHGFAAARLVAIELYLRGGVVDDTRELFRELIENAESVAGVQSAAVALRLPNELAGLRVPVRVNGLAVDSEATVTLRPVTPRYFETAGIRLSKGRDFGRDDGRAAAVVAIVNTAFVREVLSGGSAIGVTLTTSVVEREVSIIGEVADVTPNADADRPALYVSVEQIPIGGGSLLVRTTAAADSVLPALRTRIRAVAPALALDRVHEVSDSLKAGHATTRFHTQLASAFAGLALLLAAIGVYGLTAGEVAGRWRELALRLALGATGRKVVWTAMRPSVSAVGVGIAAGLAAAFFVGRGMMSLLHGITPADPVTLVLVPAILSAVGVTSAALAAARVLRTDPAAMLRAE